MFALHYHDQTKHHFRHFARSLGHLDWATQPDPFRRYHGAPVTELSREVPTASVPYAALFDGTAPVMPITPESIGELLRCSMGLSAWKQYGASQWALRVNPSSGNLHPTEAYVVAESGVWHYAPREHALEERAVLNGTAWTDWTRGAPAAAAFLVGLTSIHWREAWKYGERAFRYCQHDAGHALGALRLAAALLGWRLALLPQWSDAQLATLLGLDRDADFPDAEREEPECLAIVAAGDLARWIDLDPAPLVDAAQHGTWRGRANRLSRSRIDWPLIDEVAAATRYPGIWDPGSGIRRDSRSPDPPGSRIPDPASRQATASHQKDVAARTVILQRRSALAFDGESGVSRDAFFAMLQRLRPPGPPWDAIDWPPQVHLALFVHRVEDLAPGIYAFLRDPSALSEWKGAMRAEFLWERVVHELFLLAPLDCRRLANRVSCDQEIAEDGFFSLGMIARVEPALREHGEWFYRRLFWECGLVGQVLYLEAETAGGRATGIGCFYDEPVHDVLGLTGHAWQSLYHFSMGVPVDDPRLTTEPGYPWELPSNQRRGDDREKG